MKTFFQIFIIFFLLWACPAYSSQPLTSPSKDISLQKEVSHTIKAGFDFLKNNQNSNGSWSNPDFPALTGLALYSFFTSNKYDPLAKRPQYIEKGLAFILKNAKTNGAIYKEQLPNYNTAICLMALTAANDSQYHPYMIKARRFLASLQLDQGKRGVTDQPFDGGVGYGTKDHSDISNTYLALEALKMSQFLESDKHLALYKDLKGLDQHTLNWDAALKFIQRCQNLPEYNDQSWASNDSKNRGGFIYYPGSSKAGEKTLPDGQVVLRSYGSMTYAGLLSLIYADLKKDDPRVVAAFDWIKKNYTLKKNPGMDQQGLFYYYHTLAKALSVMEVDYLKTSDNQWVEWRKELALELVNRQKGNGSWVNDSGRWWENDPILVTSYALIAMNIINY